MSEMDEKLGAILNNPQMMQQIMQLAQSLNQPAATEKSAEAPKRQPEAPPNREMPTGFPMDMSMLQKFSNIARDGTIDKNQRALLKALDPYLSRDRIERLERAMHAAKLAQLASGFLNAGGLQFMSGR